MFFQAVSEDGYEWFNLRNPEEYEDFITLPPPDAPRSFPSKRYSVESVGVDPRRRPKRADLAWFSGGGIAIRESCVEIFGSVLESSELVEWSASPNERLLYVNPPHIHALDLAKSETLNDPMTGDYLYISKVVLKSEVVARHSIFRLPGRRPGVVFVSQGFVDLVTANSLQGLHFEPVTLA